MEPFRECGQDGAITHLRFPGRPNYDLRKIAVNLALFPAGHFLEPASHKLLRVTRSSPGHLQGHQLVEIANECFLLVNETLYDICG